ncbi:MAG TPA: chemotaxis protein CheA [Anaeromyxobacter sp.]|nr:chemotaxis protein CheA [Anaeromyxobacter sp.]
MSLDLKKYLSLYVAEAGEHLAGFARDLVLLEKAAREGGGADASEAIASCFRHAHSVKGMSASMQLDGIAAVAHRAEDLVDVFRKDASRLDARAVDLLLAVGDVLQDMVSQAAAGASPPADPGTMERLAEAARQLREGGGAEEPDPGAVRAEPPRGPSRVVRVEVEVAGGCPVPAVRGFLVVKKLGGVGAVTKAKPSVDELRAGRIPGRKLEVQLETAETLQAIERALAQISDLSAVSLAEDRSAAPPEHPPAPKEADRGAAEPSRTVRVRTELLDGFLDAVGELILATARIREIGKALPAGSRAALDEGVDRLHAIVKDLHDKVMTVRMTPIALLTDRLPRVARDVARKVGKQVELAVQGAEIEIDRAILEELSDPLLHVIRNAVDHGVEPSHLRLLAGKPAAGRISVTARRERDRVILEVSDDGKGMDPAKLRESAVARGTLSAEDAAALSDREALLLACLPGVSTAETVTDVSGRGVGLDAVKRAVEALGGTLEIESAPGAGSLVTFRLPLTVAVQPVLLVRIGDEVLGLPIAKVHGAAQVAMSRLDHSRGAPVLPYQGDLVPVHDLTELLGFPSARAVDERSVVVAEGGEGRVGLAVDALLGQHEAVLKPLGAPLDAVPGLSAVTVLGNGRPVFILDVQRLLAA